ncbi:hypothetical protein KQS73_11705, partial [Staphylococcus pseudintermedius]|nr:hypothetical protein [Staphylococcus pseudintermedius]
TYVILKPLKNDIFKPLLTRIKKFAVDGIKNKDMHDKKVIYMFNKVYEELVHRINLIEGE